MPSGDKPGGFFSPARFSNLKLSRIPLRERKLVATNNCENRSLFPKRYFRDSIVYRKAIMFRVTQAQMEKMSDLSLAKTELDIVDALNRHFNAPDTVSCAINWPAMPGTDRARLVHQIVKIGVQHGFALRGELYALVEAAVLVGPRDLLADAVLEHLRLSPHEKISVMMELCHQRVPALLGAD